MKNNTQIKLDSRHLPAFAFAWQLWKVLDTGASILFRVALLSGVMFFFFVAFADSPLVNKKADIRAKATKQCIGRGLSNMSLNRYDVYRICEAYGINVAESYSSQQETQTNF